MSRNYNVFDLVLLGSNDQSTQSAPQQQSTPTQQFEQKTGIATPTNDFAPNPNIEEGDLPF